ncbi:hypothetical protein CRUP_001020 [Coryphaenoides rupestris]|nr:hypothetical protein CRUP_001020 [Coryphaenoides rupestris]
MEEVEQEEEGVGVEVEEEVEEDDFELVVSFTYTDDSTGMLHQTRTSYAAEDIRWGQRFRDMCYKVDYALFNQTNLGPGAPAQRPGLGPAWWGVRDKSGKSCGGLD